jgi:hypothetical protein
MSGQINRGSALGEIIFELASDKSYKSYLEIGTWNGQGSTRCFLDALLKRDDDWQFYSIESSLQFYEMATHFWGDSLPENAHLIHGRIIESEDVFSLGDLRAEGDFIPAYDIWHSNDTANYNTCENVEDTLPDFFDVVLFDGGEFSTYSEFLKLKDKLNIVILDDTKELKTRKVKLVLEEEGWENIISSEERNGFAAYKK